jgi:outer membrane protein OmpA-like peptidoglycan-associated protein
LKERSKELLFVGLVCLAGCTRQVTTHVPGIVPARQTIFLDGPTPLVFFNWGDDRLTERARKIVDQLARLDGIPPPKGKHFEINGYTDASGSPSYNLRLGKRRAESVARELERRGCPADKIKIASYGARFPLVQTANGKTEPQNRRVELLLIDDGWQSHARP